MTDHSKKNGPCSNCKTVMPLQLHVQLMHSGAHHFMWICSGCGRHPGGVPLYVASEKVMAKLSVNQMESLPVLMPGLYNRCAVCGVREAELHHWAPTGIFGEESGKWPQDYLCKKHHDQWHKMVTPQLVKEEYRK